MFVDIILYIRNGFYHFVCGYCVGFYFFDLIRPRRKFKKFQEEIIYIFLSYKNNNGINVKSFGENELK